MNRKSPVEPIISVSCASDARYFCGLLVTLHSICTSVRQGANLCFHVLDAGLTDSQRDFLGRKLKAIPNITVTICFHSIELVKFKQYVQWRGSHVAYARLLLQDILLEESYTIYTDVDTLWRRDIGALWALRDEHALLAVQDGSGISTLSGAPKLNRLLTEQLNPPLHAITVSDYFCSGVLVMNLKWLREHHFTQRVNTFYAKYGSQGDFFDQDVLNILLPPPMTQLLPDVLWDEFSTTYGMRDLTLPRVIHYANNAPWTHKLSSVGMLWWNYLVKTIGITRKEPSLRPLLREYRYRNIVYRLLRSPFFFYLRYLPSSIFNPKLLKKKKRVFFPECMRLDKTNS